MNWFKNNIKKILSVLLIVLVLGVAYFAGEEAPSVENGKSVEKSEVDIQELISPPKENEESTPAESTDTETEIINEEDTGNAEEPSSVEENAEQSLPESTPLPAEEKNTDLVCTLSVRCDTINNNLNLLDEAKHTIVPSDGIIFEKSNLVFSEGDSVFDILLREMKNNGIHFEYSNTPIYEGVYIEGIGNIYEFDCGSRSGWLYCVNGEFPGYSCSQHKIESGDVIKVLYTCDMGKDVGK